MELNDAHHRIITGAQAKSCVLYCNEQVCLRTHAAIRRWCRDIPRLLPRLNGMHSGAQLQERRSMNSCTIMELYGACPRIITETYEQSCLLICN